MNWDLLIAIARYTAIPGFILASYYVYMLRQVRGQMSAKARLQLVDPAEHQGEFATLSDYHHWAEANGFAWVGAFTYIAPGNPRTVLSCWRRGADGIVMACYLMAKKPVIDFVSVYHDDSGLTTCSAAAGVLYPRAPGIYKQAFPHATLDDLLRQHLKGDEYLRSAFSLRRPAKQEAVETLFVRGVARIAKRVWRLWFFPLRAFQWYFTMNQRANIPIEIQKVQPPTKEDGRWP
jgi:hypothetical protein